MDDVMRDRAERARKAAQARWAQTPRLPTLSKTLRIDPDLWIKIVDRAGARKVTPNEWLVRCIKDALKRLEEAK